LASSILLFQSGSRVSPRGRLGAVTTQLMLNRHPRLLFFGSAALTAIVFLVALHPATGVLGGLIYLLTARALPTIMVVALALGFAWLLPVPLAVRIAVALPLSFLLGLNTALPVLLDLVRYSPAVSYEVRRAAVWSAERHPVVNVKKRRWGPIFVVPFGSRVRVAGDEGCGCMYFRDAAQALYSDRVIATLFDAVGERGGVTDYTGSTTERMDVHIELTVWKEPDGYRALVEFFDHGEKIAAFAQRRIPFRALTDRAGVGRQRLADNFYENAFDILLHDNIFSFLLNAVMPEYFSRGELRAFLLEAIGRR